MLNSNTAGSVVLPGSEQGHIRPPMHVGWFVASRSMDVASVRYRCFHMVQALRQLGVTSSIYIEGSKINKVLDQFNALVIVKRLGNGPVELVAAANDRRLPVFLDLCDDLLSAEYRSERLDLHRAVFRAIAPRLDGIITTGAAMSERVRGYGVPTPPIFEIPDIAETGAVLSSVEEFASKLSPENVTVTAEMETTAAADAGAMPDGIARHIFRKIRDLGGKPTGEPAAPQVRPTESGLKQVIWFGNHGGAHSNFGMLSLITAAPALRAVHAKMPFNLVVVTNHNKKFDSFLTRIGVPVRYVQWTTEVVYEELAKSDVALLTSGDDDFCTVKSANRALQALVCGVPVVAPSSPALRDLSDCVFLDDIEKGLMTYLGDPQAGADAIAKSKQIIKDKYSLEAVGGQWFEILNQFQTSKVLPSFQKRPGEPARLLVLIDSKRDLNGLKGIISKVRRRGVRVMTVVTENAGRESADVFEYLAAEGMIPTFAAAEELEGGDARWLRAADAVVLATESSLRKHRAAHALARLARMHGVPVFLTELGADVPEFFEKRPDPVVIFNSDVIFTSKGQDELPAWVQPELRARCVFLPSTAGDGQPSPAARIAATLLGRMLEPT